MLCYYYLPIYKSCPFIPMEYLSLSLVILFVLKFILVVLKQLLLSSNAYCVYGISFISNLFVPLYLKLCRVGGI